MQTIGSQMGIVLEDLRQALTDSAKETRQYNKQSSYNYKPENARFKLVVWFKDGNRRTYYSYDNVYHNKIVHLDEYEALLKLMRLVNTYAGKFKNAIIYATLDPGRNKDSNYNHIICWTKITGEHLANKAATFSVKDKDNVLNLDRLELYTGSQFKGK